MTHHDSFPISSGVGPIGFTPHPEDPNLPGGINFPPIGEWEDPIVFPEPPFGGGGPHPIRVRCNLKLKEGCYRLNLENTLPPQLSRGFQGTLRVQDETDLNGNPSFEISGDLYRQAPPVLHPNPPGLPIPILQRPRIPIFSRKSYHSYLKVVGVTQTRTVLLGQKCTITLTVEEYRYTPPANESTHGNFPTTPSRTLRIVLESATPPSGHAGPSFTGKVFQGANQLPFVVKMDWVSKFFRRASLELESVGNTVIPEAAGPHTFQTIYASAGWDLNVVKGNTGIALPAEVNASGRWTNAQLHAFMAANRGVSNLDTDWRYYYVAVPKNSEFSGIFGIMFDQIGDQREGSCNFIDNMTGNFGDAFSKLRSAAHEVGHGFNQLHPQNEDPVLALENFIMTQSGDTRNAILNAGGTYPDDIRFEFSPHHRHHLIHAPDIMVRPGGEDFGFGHGTSGHNPEDADVAESLGLSLTLSTVRNHIKLGEPLQLNMTLTNNGPTALPVPQSIAWSTPNTHISVGKVDADMRSLSPFVHVCDSTGYATLDAGQSISNRENVFWDTSGFVFTQPGVHKVEVDVHWNVDGVGLALSAEHFIWVDYPVTAKENEAAAALMHPEVGKYVALGGNAKHLDVAVERIGKAAKVASNHPGYDCIAQLDADAAK
jgi:hypothetical protein